MIQNGPGVFKVLFSFITVILLAVVSAYGGALKVKDGECLKRYNITRNGNPWSGFTSSYEEEEASKKIAALSLKDSGYNPVPSLEKYKRSGRCLIGRNEKLHRIAVEKSLFSDLNRADATADTGGKFLVGRYKDLQFRFFRPAELAEFLLEAQVINTYWHVEADFCLVWEEDTSDSYTARYKGKHIYYTNSENEGPLDFRIIIDKKTGEIFVEAGTK